MKSVPWDDLLLELVPEILIKNAIPVKDITAKRVWDKTKDIRLVDLGLTQQMVEDYLVKQYKTPTAGASAPVTKNDLKKSGKMSPPPVPVSLVNKQQTNPSNSRPLTQIADTEVPTDQTNPPKFDLKSSKDHKLESAPHIESKLIRRLIFF